MFLYLKSVLLVVIIYLFRAHVLSTSKKSLILACASVTKNAAMARRAKEWQEVVQSTLSLQLTCVCVQT